MDLIRYIDLCQRGVFYEALMESPLLAPYLPRDSRHARDDVKNAIIPVFFGEPERIKNWRPAMRAMDAALKDMFPSVHAFLTMLRSIEPHDGGDANHSHAAKTLQNIESSIIVNGVCTTLMNERPDMPLLTIHDALIVPDVDVEYVQGVIRAEFAQWGLSPAMKAEPLDPQTAVAAVA